MWILLAIIFLMPFEANPYLQLGDSFLGIFPDFTMIKLLGLVGLGWVFLQSMETNLQLRILESGQAKAFVLYLASVSFAVVASGASLLLLTRFFSIVLFFPLVLTAVRTKENLLLALKTATAILICIFPYAYRQVVRFGGRLGVGLYDSNYLALGLILLLPLAFVFARQETVGWKRTFWKCGTGVLFLEIIMTASRGAFVGLLVILPLISFRLVEHRGRALIGLVTLLWVSVFILPTSMGDRLLSSRMDSEVEDYGAQASVELRLEILSAGLRMIQDNPLTGVGLGQFKSAVTTYGSEIPKMAHSTYVEIGAETGLGSLLAFLLVIFFTFRSLRYSEQITLAQNNPHFAELAIGVQIGLAGYVVSALFLSAQFEKFFWLIIFLSICFERIVKTLYSKIHLETQPV